MSAPVSGTHDYGVHKDDRLTKALDPELKQQSRMTGHFMHWLRRESTRRNLPDISNMGSPMISDLVNEFYYSVQDI